jgi:type I restriction enzyme S subunit
MTEVEFGSLFQFIRNGMNIKQDKSGRGLPISRIETISNGIVDPSRVGFAGLEEDDCRHWLLSDGDILFSHINSVEHLGKSAVYEGLPHRLVHGMNLLCLRANQERILPRYAHYLMKSPRFRSQFAKSIKPAVNQASVSISDLRKITVQLPPLAEQRRIAAILDAADALRQKRRQALRLLDQLTQAIFVEMFGDPISNTRSWPVTPLDEVIPKERPLTYGILMPGEDVEGGVLYVRVVDMKDGAIDLSGIRRTTPEISQQYKRSLLQSGDLLISIRGHVGRTAIVPRELTGANITQDTARIYSTTFDLRFLQGVLRHPSTQIWFARRTKGAAVKGINLGDLRQLPVISPSRADQERFADTISKLEAAKAAMTKQFSGVNSLFASLQHRAFRGEL